MHNPQACHRWYVSLEAAGVEWEVDDTPIRCPQHNRHPQLTTWGFVTNVLAATVVVAAVVVATVVVAAVVVTTVSAAVVDFTPKLHSNLIGTGFVCALPAVIGVAADACPQKPPKVRSSGLGNEESMPSGSLPH